LANLVPLTSKETNKRVGSLAVINNVLLCIGSKCSELIDYTRLGNGVAEMNGMGRSTDSVFESSNQSSPK